MNDQHSTVLVEPYDGYPALRMIWQRNLQQDHVIAAFRTIKTYLTMYDEPHYVVVDIRKSPRFPVQTTVKAALDGVYQHENLKQWLVIGRDLLAETIANTLQSMSGQKKVVWFDNEDEVINYLDENTLTGFID